jgi:hypothetical protein
MNEAISALSSLLSLISSLGLYTEPASSLTTISISVVIKPSSIGIFLSNSSPVEDSPKDISSVTSLGFSNIPVSLIVNKVFPYTITLVEPGFKHSLFSSLIAQYQIFLRYLLCPIKGNLSLEVKSKV